MTDIIFDETFDIPYNPLTKAESFAKLMAEGMSPDNAFIALTIATACGAPGVLDGEHMAEIRGLVAEYAAFTGQESLLWAKA